MTFLSRALRRFSAMTRYMLCKACRDSTVSSVPRYVGIAQLAVA